MDHRGLRARLTGAGCTSCGAAVPVDRIAVLADRGDFAFVELRCAACGSRTMGLVLAAPDDEAPVLDTAGDEGAPRPAGPDPAPATLTEADVLEMRRFLAGWSGDLHTLLDGQDPASGGAGG